MTGGYIFTGVYLSVNEGGGGGYPWSSPWTGFWSILRGGLDRTVGYPQNGETPADRGAIPSRTHCAMCSMPLAITHKDFLGFDLFFIVL